MGYLVTFYFIAMDFFTGLLRAFATDSFSSKRMRLGLFHKVSLLSVLALGWLMEYAQRFVDLGVTVPVGTAACVYIALMETGSTLENLCETNPELMPDRLCEMFGVGTAATTGLTAGGPPSDRSCHALRARSPLPKGEGLEAQMPSPLAGKGEEAMADEAEEPAVGEEPETQGTGTDQRA